MWGVAAGKARRSRGLHHPSHPHVYFIPPGEALR
ncbi:unnamed protein product [Victoria cruziana]